MKKITLFLSAAFLFFNSFAQLNINTSVTANDLVQTLVGTGFVFSNATLNCETGAFGIFGNGSTTNIGLDSGIVLTTGSALNILGPNNATGLGTDNAGGSDPDLALIISPITVNDACILEFDVIPICDTLRFNYVFGSEEYLEFVGSNIKDVFGFFISGPGILMPDSNIALVPGTTIPVTIDDINNVDNSTYYIDNPFGTTIQYDGFTTILTAEAIVQACSTYHVKLAIGDGSDGILDSGVLLRKGSLNCFGVAITASTSGSSGIDAVEACQDGVFEMCLSQAQDQDYVFYFTVGGTASNGVDYLFFPDSIIFPAGVQCVYTTVEPVIDGITEGSETLMIYYTPSICATLDSAYINILDLYSVNAGPDLNVCAGETGIIGPPIVGGTTYTWNKSFGLSDSTINQPTVDIANTNDTNTVITQYVLYAEISGCSNTDTVMVFVHPIPVPVAGSDVTVCAGQAASIGGPPKLLYNYSWSPPLGISLPTSSLTDVVLANPGSTPLVVEKIVTATRSGCVGTDTVLITVLWAPTSDAGSDIEFCSGQTMTIGSLPVSGFNYSWTPPTGLTTTSNSFTQVTLTNTGNDPITQGYYLSAGAIGCTDIDTVFVTVKPYPKAAAGLDVSICPNSATPIGANNTSTYTYSWSPVDGLSSATASNPNVNLANETTAEIISKYYLTVNQSGCISYDTVQVMVRRTPLASIKIEDDTLCINSAGVLSYDGATLNSGAYTWDLSSATSSSGSDAGPYAVSWSAIGQYTVSLIVSEHGCPSAPVTRNFNVIDCSVNPSNILTADGDGVNDRFYIVNMERNPNSRLEIYNRWGKRVYETDSYSNDWSGGDNVSPGVYFYVLLLQDGTEKRGTLTLVR